MNRFTTRVELHQADSDDYDTLHDEMKSEGFSRTISLEGENVVYHMPTAEYNKHGENMTSEQVLEAAKRAASKTGNKYSVLVTKTTERRYWHNLEAVKK